MVTRHVSVYEDKNVVCNCHVNDLTLWETFLLSLWSFSIFYLIFKTLRNAWLAQSFKQFDLKPPKVEKLVVCCTPKPHHSHELNCENLVNWLLLFMDAIVNVCILWVAYSWTFNVVKFHQVSSKLNIRLWETLWQGIYLR
jgi:hypothetical protein